MRTPAFAAARGPSGEPLRIGRTSTEQSNTSIVYGNRLILKLFRRIQPGVNPDYEIGRHLAERRFARVPAVAAALEYERPADQPATIGMMQQLVDSQADGWSHAIGELGRFYEYVSERAPIAESLPQTASAMLESNPSKAVADAIGSYLETASTLGRRTAEMHLALAANSGDPAFSPEPFTPDDLAALSIDISAQARKAFDGLGTTVGKLPAETAADATRLLNARDVFLERFGSAPPLEFSASKIRVHGDYHLGQVLWSEGDFFIIDFEGEPARPLAERRQKQSPLKDVAGMLRSFSYAAYASLFAHAASRPVDIARLEPWARTWQTWTTAAFLRGYLNAADGALFVPAVPAQRDELLRLFMVDKALYELTYEVNNRLEWVRIPLKGVEALLNGAS